ncbi:MAG: discoidin domain-containing protein [Phycisphaerae bacterium]|nr:discoidin domain-containing protein [Phycisphaerae bacterium]
MMKRTSMLAAVAVVAVVEMTWCGTSQAALIDVAASASSTYSQGVANPSDAVNGVGLTGGTTHSTDYQSGWLGAASLVNAQFFVIDLKQNYLLDATSSLKFWNGKYSTGNDGFRKVKFWLSNDGTNWTDVTSTTTIRDSANSIVSLMPKGTGAGFDGTVSFGANSKARYIKIEADGASGAGNYSGDRLALSEIQAFGTATGSNPTLSNRITTITATGSGVNYSTTSPTYAVNGTGLTGVGDQHKGNYDQGTWLVQNTQTASLDINLASQKTIQGLKIWNLCGNIALGPNDISETNDGMKTIDIFVSNDGATWNQVFDNLTLPMGDETPNASGKYYDSPFVLDTRSIAGQWQYVRISNVGNTNPNYSGPHVGLSEVQVFSTFTAPVPEPATMAFLALGGLTMMGAAIRRRRTA